MDIPDQLEFISAVMTASIAHEVNQPLAAAMTGAEACLRWLDRETPDIAKACGRWNWSSTTFAAPAT